jgi:hypothetical protein
MRQRVQTTTKDVPYHEVVSGTRNITPAPSRIFARDTVGLHLADNAFVRWTISNPLLALDAQGPSRATSCALDCYTQNVDDHNGLPGNPTMIQRQVVTSKPGLAVMISV